MNTGEIWLTRDGNKVKVTDTNIAGWYQIEVQNLVTKEVYTVDRNGRWESHYDHEDSTQDLIKRITDENN